MDQKYVLAHFEELEEELRAAAYDKAQNLALKFLEIEEVQFWEDIPKEQKEKWATFCRALDDKKLLTSGCLYLNTVMRGGEVQ